MGWSLINCSFRLWLSQVADWMRITHCASRAALMLERLKGRDNPQQMLLSCVECEEEATTTTVSDVVNP